MRNMPRCMLSKLTKIQLSSAAQSCLIFATSWTAAPQASLSITNARSSLQLTSIKSVMPSSHLILCRPLLLPIPPSIRVFSNESTLLMRWPKYWFQPQYQSFQWIFRVSFFQDWLVWSPCCPRNSKASSSAPQFESISFSVFSLLHGPALTSVYD